MLSFRRMILASVASVCGVMIVNGSVVLSDEPGAVVPAAATVTPADAKPLVVTPEATPPAPPAAETPFVDVEVEAPEVAYVIVDGVTHSKRGKLRKLRLSRRERKRMTLVVANWSEMGQDRRIERLVDLSKPTRIIFTLDDLTANEQQLLDMTNQARANSGLPMLRIDPRLCRAARLHSANMARYNSMSHYLEGRSHQNRTAEAGYPSGMVAENICASQRDPQSAVYTWLNSSGHRANMLSYQYADIGVGIAYNSNGSPYYTQVFGR